MKRQRVTLADRCAAVCEHAVGVHRLAFKYISAKDAMEFANKARSEMMAILHVTPQQYDDWLDSGIAE